MISVIPDSLGGHLSTVTALFSATLTFFLSNDAFYYGIVLILSSIGEHLGISSDIIGRASLVGQATHLLSPMVISPLHIF